MTIWKMPDGEPFSDLSDLMEAGAAIKELAPAGHPIHGIVDALTRLANRANANPQCPECIGLVGITAFALMGCPTAEMPRLDMMLALLLTNLDRYTHDAP
jgi:hypothetical protein